MANQHLAVQQVNLLSNLKKMAVQNSQIQHKHWIALLLVWSKTQLIFHRCVRLLSSKPDRIHVAKKDLLQMQGIDSKPLIYHLLEKLRVRNSLKSKYKLNVSKPTLCKVSSRVALARSKLVILWPPLSRLRMKRLLTKTRTLISS